LIGGFTDSISNKYSHCLAIQPVGQIQGLLAEAFRTGGKPAVDGFADDEKGVLILDFFHWDSCASFS
jgi:hypothetical protein